MLMQVAKLTGCKVIAVVKRGEQVTAAKVPDEPLTSSKVGRDHAAISFVLTGDKNTVPGWRDHAREIDVPHCRGVTPY